MPPQRINAVVLLLLLCLLFSLFTTVIFSEETVSLSAKSAALYEPSQGAFLYRKNETAPLPMASTTKIMTALVAIERGNIEDTVTVRADEVGLEGSSLYLKAGERMSVSDLLYGLMLRSANDAAEILARHIGGSVETFVSWMNEKAAELGLENTHFDNPHGLDSATHYTTAADLAKLSAAALENPFFHTLVSTKRTVIGEGESRRLVVNHNKLLLLYDGAVGVKTGFTKKSGRCLVSAAERDGVRLVAVTIQAPDDWQDHIRLLDYGFSLTECRRVAPVGERSYTVSVVGGVSPSVRVTNTDAFCPVVLKSAAPFTVETDLPRLAAAPIVKGQVLGRLTVKQGEKTVAVLPLYAAENVSLPSKKRFRKNNLEI